MERESQRDTGRAVERESQRDTGRAVETESHRDTGRAVETESEGHRQRHGDRAEESGSRLDTVMNGITGSSVMEYCLPLKLNA